MGQARPAFHEPLLAGSDPMDKPCDLCHERSAGTGAPSPATKHSLQPVAALPFPPAQTCLCFSLGSTACSFHCGPQTPAGCRCSETSMHSDTNPRQNLQPAAALSARWLWHSISSTLFQIQVFEDGADTTSPETPESAALKVPKRGEALGLGAAGSWLCGAGRLSCGAFGPASQCLPMPPNASHLQPPAGARGRCPLWPSFPSSEPLFLLSHCLVLHLGMLEKSSDGFPPWTACRQRVLTEGFCLLGEHRLVPSGVASFVFFPPLMASGN